jgi:hypothetical protein
MTPKEKAIELYNKFMTMPFPTHTDRAKQCALIAVDEILNEFPQGFKGNFEERRKQYWKEVKKEIELL